MADIDKIQINGNDYNVKDTKAQTDLSEVASDLTETKESLSQLQTNALMKNNVKTINGQSIVGSGNITIEGESGTSNYNDLTNKPTLNGTELKGAVTIAIPTTSDIDTEVQSYWNTHKSELKGDKGDKGNDGYTPIKGTDYFTDADKSELVADVISALPTAESEVY